MYQRCHPIREPGLLEMLSSQEPAAWEGAALPAAASIVALDKSHAPLTVQDSITM